MPLAEDNANNRYTITAYEADSINVSEVQYKSSIILSPSKLIDWSVSQIDELSEAHCDQIIEQEPQVVLLGTGEKQVFPKVEIYAYFAKHQIGLEVMANHAACRTFNILAAEDRHVVVGFIL